jgi:hypothetical protein
LTTFDSRGRGIFTGTFIIWENLRQFHTRDPKLTKPHCPVYDGRKLCPSLESLRMTLCKRTLNQQMVTVNFKYGDITDILFVCLFFIYSRLSNFSAIRRLSPLPVTGLQI